MDIKALETYYKSNLLKYASTAADELGCHGILKIDGVSTHTLVRVKLLPQWHFKKDIILEPLRQTPRLSCKNVTRSLGF